MAWQPIDSNQQPVAWLKRGGKIFVDAVHIAKVHAERSMANDPGSEVVPLYISPPPGEEKKQERLSEQRISELLVESGIMNHRYPSQPMFNDLIRLAEAEHGITSNAEGGV